MPSGDKQPHPKLAAYIENVVSRAYSKGILDNNYGAAARFAELLGPEVSRQLVWSWIWQYDGVPRNRVGQLSTLNARLDIEMSEAELEMLLQPRKEGIKPAQLLFEEIERSILESGHPAHVMRERIADHMGVTTRTLFRYKADGDIPRTKLAKLKQALIALDIGIRPDVIVAVFEEKG